MTALLEIEGLGIRLPIDGNERAVVRDLSMSVAEGEAVALVGESGGGKTLTGRAIARLLPPGAKTDGVIRVAGKQVLALNRRELRSYRTHDLGLIFQDPRSAINPVRRVGDFLVEALVASRDVGRAEARREVGRLLNDVGIADHERRLNQFPHELSGGLLQRVMIASVLAMRPRLIIADEPTTALDVTTQSEVMAILKEMQERLGMAMVLITHDLELAAAVCERTAVMYAGKLVEVQPSATLHQDPLHPYTAALVTSRPSVATVNKAMPVIVGRPLSAYEAPIGCPFATRCSHARPQCWTFDPPLEPFAEGRVACIRAEELRGAVGPLPVPEEVFHV